MVGSAADYKLLCPQGGCMDPDQFELCKWATVPSHAVVVNPSRVGADVRQQLRMLFAGAQDLQPFKNLFFKTEAGGVVNPGDLIFKGSTYGTLIIHTGFIVRYHHHDTHHGVVTHTRRTTRPDWPLCF